MPNRTIYLPDDVDQLARDLDVNLSQVTQQALREIDRRRRTEDESETVEERLARLRHLVAEANITFPPNYLRDMRAEAGDDLR